MRRFIFFVMTFTAISVSAGRLCTDSEFAKEISKDLPEGVESIALRILQCNHMGEEVGYGDKERAKQIEDGVKKAKCESLDKDRMTLLKRYSNSTKIHNAFAAADSWQGVCDAAGVSNTKEKCIRSSCWGHKGCNYETCTREDGTTYTKFIQ